MGNNYDRLLELAKTGHSPSTQELHSIRSQLSSGRFEGDPYTLLHILGTCGDIGSLPTVQKYIDYDSGNEEDGMVRRLAIQVIGRMWAIPESLETVTRKAFEDPDKYVRSAAATIIGYLGNRYASLRKQASATLLRGLEGLDGDDYTRESFYRGLLELLAVPPAEWPPIDIPLTQEMLHPEILSKARALCREQTSDGRADPEV